MSTHIAVVVSLVLISYTFKRYEQQMRNTKRKDCMAEKQ